MVLELTSWTCAVLDTLSLDSKSNSVFVWSSIVFPSPSCPLSEVSVTLFEFAGEEATAETVLNTAPAFIASCVIVKVAT